MKKNELARRLFEIEAIKFGHFTLKSGLESPIYFDLRVCVSYPDILREIAAKMWDLCIPLKFDSLCGVPYTALPIATAISLAHDLRMLMRRKEVKSYGTKRAIEGAFAAGENCLVIEDLVTSGVSSLETIHALKAQELKVSDVIVLLDREQGGKEHLSEAGYQLHAVFTVSELLSILLSEDCIDQKTAEEVSAYIASNCSQKPVLSI